MDKEETIAEWETNVPVGGNRLFLFQMGLAVGIGALFVLLLLIGLNLYEGSWQWIPRSLTVGGALFAGLYLFMWVIGALFYHGGVPTRYRITDRGIYQFTLEGKRGLLSRLGWLGLLQSGSAGYEAAGAAMVADAGRAIFNGWGEIVSMERTGENEIRIGSPSWTKMQIYCPRGECDRIAGLVGQRMAGKSASIGYLSLPGKLALSFFGILFVIYLLPPLPIRVVPLFTLLLIPSWLITLWGSRWQGVAAGVTATLSIVLPAVSVWADGIAMKREGAIYALALELLFYAYFFVGSLYMILKRNKA